MNPFQHQAPWLHKLVKRRTGRSTIANYSDAFLLVSQFAVRDSSSYIGRFIDLARPPILQDHMNGMSPLVLDFFYAPPGPFAALVAEPPSLAAAGVKSPATSAMP